MKFWYTARKKYSIHFVLVFLFIFCTFANPNFLSVNNMTNISTQLAVTTILAFGATMLIISGMLDLSAGSVLALSGVFAVSVYKSTGSMILAILAGILTGVVCNVINAVMISTFKTPPFIATLAMMAVARGVALYFTQGQNILQLGDFVKIGQGTLGIIPIPVIFLIAFGILTWYLLNHTRFGRSLYAVGGNEEAAVASGINVHKIKYTAFIINGIFVGIAGVLFMARVNAGLPNGAINYEFTALTASIVGGTSFSGGIGTAGGTLVGAFIVGFLDNIMNLNGVNSYLQQIIRGGIIALAVIYDIRTKGRRTKQILGNSEKKNEQKQTN
ncbi:ABC transporter permease [Cohnella sp. REN36]|uniref:ABC transporter permease n=1 Tax=Cohnella sp. REN36 TaxID=2887347 RepID=UPI001D14E702|nr:ABC transporter permease [Cohnella sp. REN36]MCC3373855.1 ABC transporter permease [Cohnella sp. REN36]